MKVALDSNVFISALIKSSKTREILVNSSLEFFMPELSLIEIKNHKDELVKKSGLEEKDFDSIFEKLLEYVNLVRVEEISHKKEEALGEMANIDKDDAVFVACALAFSGSIIWSDDRHLKRQEKVRVLSTSEIIEKEGFC